MKRSLSTNLIPLWLAFELVLCGCAGPERAADVPGDPNSPARKLYIAKCARCHKFYDPAKYPEPEWQTWMAKMSKKAKLNAEQEELLSRYIEENFRSLARTNSSQGKP